MQIKSLLLIAAAATPLLAAPAPDVDGGVTAQDVVDLWTSLSKIALEEPNAEAGVGARQDLHARACPYKDHGTCIYLEGLKCTAGCMAGTIRQSNACMMRCNAVPMNACHTMGC